MVHVWFKKKCCGEETHEMTPTVYMESSAVLGLAYPAASWDLE